MAAAGKDTLYIELEDEITAVIEKVVDSKQKIVAIVLPKRATVFHSIVNLKLLKKASSAAKKNIVLVTSDTTVLAIAGTAGVHVAKTPTSKPLIPAAAVSGAAITEDINLGSSESPPAAAETSSETSDKSPDEIEIDNTDAELKEVPKAEKKEKSKKKFMRIPDFSSFSLRLGLAIGGFVLLVVLWVIGFVIMPRATITVNTDVSTTSINSTLTARVGSEELDLENNIIPASREQVEKIDSITVSATGEKNIGSRATGTINLTNCIKSDGVQVVPAGTRFSAGGITFETSEQAVLPEASFNPSGSQCKSKDDGEDKTVSAIALDPGENSNIGSQTLNSSISGIIAVGSNMSGGTSEIVKVISAEDIEKAKQELDGKSRNEALSELKTKLTSEGNRAIEETLSINEAQTVAAPAIGSEAPETKVTMTVNYSMLGLKDQDLNTVLDQEVKNNLGESPINIRSNGLDGMRFSVSEASDAEKTILIIDTIATIGPEINQAAIKQNSAGKKRGDIEKDVESIEGVRSVSVEYSPFWITTTPRSADKISVIVVEGEESQ